MHLGSALYFVHSLGVAHRDLKPANILLDAAGARAKLCDFGCAIRSNERFIRQPVPPPPAVGSEYWLFQRQYCFGEAASERQY